MRRRRRIENPRAVALVGLGFAAIVTVLVLLGPVPEPRLVTALTWLGLLGSTAVAGIVIFRQRERDREADSRHSTCPHCGYGTMLVYRTGKQLWVHAVTEREKCGRLWHPVLPVPVSPGRPPR